MQISDPIDSRRVRRKEDDDFDGVISLDQSITEDGLRKSEDNFYEFKSQRV